MEHLQQSLFHKKKKKVTCPDVRAGRFERGLSGQNWVENTEKHSQNNVFFSSPMKDAARGAFQSRRLAGSAPINNN